VFSRTRGGTLWALPFDVDQLEPISEPVPVLEGVQISTSGLALASLASDGSLVYVPQSASSGDRTLVWVDKAGNESYIDAPPRAYRAPRLSPDETSVAVEVVEAHGTDIWIFDLVRGTFQALTRDSGQNFSPTWRPGGREIFFASARNTDATGALALYRAVADGTGTVEVVYSDPERDLVPFSWSLDGTALALSEYDRDHEDYDVGVLTMHDGGTWTPVLKEPYWEFHPALSPSGSWLAWAAQPTGPPRIFLGAFPDVVGEPWLIAPDLAFHPLWSRDGLELFFRDGSQRALMSVTIDTEPEVRIGPPELLFQDIYFHDNIGRHYDVAEDGRFLMIKPVGGVRPQTHINVVRNWVAELSERMPRP